MFSVVKSVRFSRCSTMVSAYLICVTRIILATILLVSTIVCIPEFSQSPQHWPNIKPKPSLLPQPNWRTCSLVSTTGSINIRLRRSSFPWIMRVILEHPTMSRFSSTYTISSARNSPNVTGSKKLAQYVLWLKQKPLSHSRQLGTIGEARGKLTLLQRYDLDLLSSVDQPNQIGIDLGPDRWTDNGKSIELLYNQAKNEIAYIEDFYDIELPTNSTLSDHIQAKFDVITQHLTNATSPHLHPNQLYISFASAAFVPLPATSITPVVNISSCFQLYTFLMPTF